MKGSALQDTSAELFVLIIKLRF